MGTIKTNGIIISENNFGDFDKMLTMLTPGMRKNLMYSQRGTKT
jgi:recombinational DNA repair protein (RecF pathway)